MTITNTDQRVTATQILKAGLAEMGITTLTVLAYEVSKAVLYLISPRLYKNLTPVRGVLSRQRKKKK